MPDNQAVSTPITPTADPVAPVSDTTADSSVTVPEIPSPEPVPNPVPTTDSAPSPEPARIVSSEITADVSRRINEARNVLIALSGDPSVDELSAAIGLSLYLDRLGKRATAIYSGTTPNALEFLKPEETFESTADTLQDFVIALNKEKADHLRYKLDGDYVKIYITPYKARISEEDLDFSYGDFNVDLVLSLDVANGIDLDAALREHGRIMHDAVIINITTGNPGKFGEIEWSDKTSSSVSEMVAKLLYGMGNQAKIEKEEATAFLTGIVAATNRFSNAKTSPSTMKLASHLMESGANQQLISKNITPDVENEMYSLSSSISEEPSPKEQDPTKLNIEHGNEKDADETKEVSDTITEKSSTLLDDLKAAEESLAKTGTETTPDLSNNPVRIDTKEDEKETELKEVSDKEKSLIKDEEKKEPEETAASSSGYLQSEPASTDTSSEPILPPVAESAPEKAESSSITSDTPTSESVPEQAPTTESISEPTREPAADMASEPDPATDSESETKLNEAEKIVQPPSDFSATPSDDETNKYGKMLEDALNEINSSIPQMDAASVGEPINIESGSVSSSSINAGLNPATTSAPSVPTNPEINGVPEINFMPMPGEEVLPPPPAPPIDVDSTMSAPVEPATAPATPIQPASPSTGPEPTPLGSQPAMQDQVYTPQASDPSAFKIPGM